MNVKLKEQYGLYINGQWVTASDGGTFETHNPANGEHLAYCAEATREDVDALLEGLRDAAARLAPRGRRR